MDIQEFVARVRDACNEFLAPPPSMTPVTVNGDVVISVPGTYTNQIFNGSVTVTAPDVTLDACTINGTYPDACLLTAGHRTKVNNCTLIGSPSGQHRGIRTDATGIRITNTTVRNIWWDIDTQAVGGWDGTHDLIVDNCDLEASGEVVMWGGSTLSAQENVCSDILINNCRITKNPAWRSKPGGVTCKNLFELKCARRVTIQNCLLKGSWPDGQDGYAILLTLRQDPYPWGVLEDIKILNNRIEDVSSCFDILGHDDYNAKPDAPVMTNVLIQGNEFTNVNADGQGGRCFVMLHGSKNFHVIENKITPAGYINTAFAFGPPGLLHEGLVVRGNTLPEGAYGIHGEGAPSLGKAVLDMYAPGYVWENNTITGLDPQHYVIWP